LGPKIKKVIIIDTMNKEILGGEITSLEDAQRIVGGLIERGATLENGDEVYVNEEGLFNSALKPFYIQGAHQPFVGNAYVIGRVTSTGNNRSAKSTVEEIRSIVKFLEGYGRISL
jgi:Domain of unknown function (DUF3846)